MKLLGVVVAVLIWLLPTRAEAQAVKLEDLVGTWAKFGGVPDSVKNVRAWIKKMSGPFATISTFTILPDSTFSWSHTKDIKPLNALRGDTLSFWKGDPSLCAGAQKPDNAVTDVTAEPQKQEDQPGCRDLLHKITLKGRQLTLTALGNDVRTWENGEYTRIDDPKPKP